MLIDRFQAFFAAVNEGAEPYPWQLALMLEIATTGRWPTAIAAPTGSGKTSVIDIHVFLVGERARQIGLGDDGDVIARPPRRLILVAPRRVLVDDQAERAGRLAQALARSEIEAYPGGDEQAQHVLRETASALRGLISSEGGEVDPAAGKHAVDISSPIGVARLRGGVRHDTSWRLDPSRCQVISATPQMWGSRLLFRGYRGSRLSRNLETGLLAHDCVAIVDEAHLHERLLETTEQTVRWQRRSATSMQVVAMSATRATEGARSLGPEDLEDAALARRVIANKELVVEAVADWRKKATLGIVERARALGGDGTVGVYVNTVARALEVAAALERDAEVALVCGRMRPADLALLRADRPGLLDARGNDAVGFLVTTQSLEVGVDLDLAAVVSEIASATALAQRAGRLNRSGKRTGSKFVVVAPDGVDGASPEEIDKSHRPYTGQEIIDAARWLQDLGGDISPLRITQSVIPASADTVMPRISQVELETCAMSDLGLAADVDPAFYVEEARDRVERTISICARDHLLPDGVVLAEPVVEQSLRDAPPRAHELASFSLDAVGELAKVLQELGRAVPPNRPIAWLVRTAGGERAVLPLHSAAKPRDTIKNALLPGDVLVVPSGRRITTRNVIGVGRSAMSTFDDVRHLRPGEEGPPDEVVALPADQVAAAIGTDRAITRRGTREELARLVEGSDRPPRADEVARILRKGRIRDWAVSWCDPLAEGDHVDGLLVLRFTGGEGRLPTGADHVVGLDSHGVAVEERMRRILKKLDIAAGGDEALSRALLVAARVHDAGKASPRFQQRMGNALGADLVAKALPGHTPERGDGWRHEQLSAAFAAVASSRDALTTVVVGAHHGHGVPSFDRSAEDALSGWEGCDPKVVAELERLFGARGEYEGERASMQHEHGIHRLAYLEALLRCADMQVSKEGS